MGPCRPAPLLVMENSRANLIPQRSYSYRPLGANWSPVVVHGRHLLKCRADTWGHLVSFATCNGKRMQMWLG